LKQFKKEKAAVSRNHHPDDPAHDIDSIHNPIDTINTIAASFNTNGTGEPLTSMLGVDMTVSTASVEPHQAVLSSSSRSSLSPTHSLSSSKPLSVNLPLLNMSPGELSQAQFKEQLQLHVQTIGN